MAFSLAFAWQIVNSASHSSFRDQVELAVWTVAQSKHLSGMMEGQEKTLAIRVLRGDSWPAQVAIKMAATDQVAQNAYAAGGNKLSDAVVIQWIQNHWNLLAGIAGD